MLAILLYIATLAYVPHWSFSIILLFALSKKEKFSINDISNVQFVLIILILILSTLNFIIYKFSVNTTEVIPYTILMLASYLIANRISSRELRILVYLVALECFVGYAEFALGVKTFFSQLEDNVQNSDSALIYYRSVFGLSDNSSTFAVKVLLAYLLIYFLDLKGRFTLILKVILLCGLFVTFNRTAMGVVVIFHILRFVRTSHQLIAQMLRLKSNRTVLHRFVLSSIVLLVLVFLAVNNLDEIVVQVTRRTQTIEITGRDWIWRGFIDFIQTHWLVGNGSTKFFIVNSGSIYHAHNSFLQTFASQGLIIGSLFILLIVCSLNSSNMLYVLCLVIYSMFQYGIFWGISLLDIIFLLFLRYRGQSDLADTRVDTNETNLNDSPIV